MKKHFLFGTALLAILFSFAACDDLMSGNKPGSDDEEGGGGGGSSTEKSLTPEQTKDKMYGIATGITDKFNTDDQREAIQCFDGLYGKYENYDFASFEDHYEDRFEEFFRMPRLLIQAVEGEVRASDIDRVMNFSFAEESCIWEADEQNRTWVYKGKATDNSVILRAKDKNGVWCEAKAWGEGSTHTYGYTWEEYHWVYPSMYLSESNISSGYIYSYINGQYRDLSWDSSSQLWYYYDYNYGYNRYVSTADAMQNYSYFNVYDYNGYNYYNYDYSRGQFYREDYESRYKVSDGTRTINGEVPAKIFFTFKRGETELIRFELDQEMQKNHHAYITVDAKLINLRWTADFKINSTTGSFATAFYYGDDCLISGIAHLPSYKLIEKQDGQSYEDWIESYGERYDELLRKIGAADGMADIHGQMQIKLNVENFGYVYRDIVKLDEQGVRDNTQEGAKKYCDVINEAQKNGIYFNSDVKQAEIRVIPNSYESTSWEYDPQTGDYIPREVTYYEVEPVLYFPSDKTTYGFEQYFDRKPFTNLQYTIEDLANAYIHLSNFLYNETGEIHF